MEGRSFLNVSSSPSGPDSAGDQPAIEAERGLLPLVFRVEMSRFMPLVEHSDHDPEEGRDDRHDPSPRRSWLRRPPESARESMRCGQGAAVATKDRSSACPLHATSAGTCRYDWRPPTHLVSRGIMDSWTEKSRRHSWEPARSPA